MRFVQQSLLGLQMAGLTVNLVVLFSLILAVGMLVDDAIIVVEYAERRMAEGQDRRQAFAEASHKMSGPVIASTMTRIAAFSPLLFWPGTVGEFMKYMPITLIARPFKEPPRHKDGAYMWGVGRAIRHPWIVLMLAVGSLIAVPMAYGKFGKGVEFFPNVEPDYGLLYVKARGNLSI